MNAKLLFMLCGIVTILVTNPLGVLTWLWIKIVAVTKFLSVFVLIANIFNPIFDFL
jgi:hypothetical protein